MESGHTNFDRWWQANPRPIGMIDVPDGIATYIYALEQRIRWLETGIWCYQTDKKEEKQ